MGNTKIGWKSILGVGAVERRGRLVFISAILLALPSAAFSAATAEGEIEGRPAPAVTRASTSNAQK